MQWNEIKTSLYDLDYISSEELAMSIHIAINLERPLLLEGEAGIGKTTLALALSKLYKTSLIRLQCYEGLDASSTIYEWNYQKQLLSIRLNENKNDNNVKIDDQIFSREFLLERPLLKALTQKKSPILLIDEIDRADEDIILSPPSGGTKFRYFQINPLPEGVPDDMLEYKLNSETLLVNVIYQSGLLKSKSEARRMIKQGAVKINGSAISDLQTIVKPGEEYILKVGKRRFLRLT